jgi:hypothetical protein
MKLIPVLLCLLLTACTRAEGAISPPKLITEEIDLNQLEMTDKSLLPQVEPEALEPVFNYVMALNLALTGDLSKLKQSADASCGCLDIADRLESFFPTASLIGGGYEISGVWLEKDELTKKIFKVEINRSDITKVDKKNGQQVIWSASIITNQFIVERRGQAWVLTDTK